MLNILLLAILGHGLARQRQRRRWTVTGDAHAAQAQAARVMGAVGSVEHGPGLCLLVQRVVGALGLSGQLIVAEYDVLCVLNVRYAATGGQFGGYS